MYDGNHFGEVSDYKAGMTHTGGSLAKQNIPGI
jgi:hypothetical protein